MPFEAIRYARIDITYFFWSIVISKQDCSIKDLIVFYLYRKSGFEIHGKT